MTDNVTANPGAGGATFASEDLGGVQLPLSKPSYGPHGTSTPVTLDNGMPVQPAASAVFTITGAISNSSFGAAQSGSWSVSVSNFPATQDVSVINFPATQPVSLASLPALAAGTNAIGAITNTSFGISGNLPAFASTPTVNVGTSALALETGGNLASVSTTNTAISTAIGTQSDVAYTGSGSGSLIAMLKGIYAKLAATLSVSLTSNASTDGSATITTGGTAQNLFGGSTPSNGFAICNPDATNDLWVSDSATAAANGLGSIRISANGGYYSTEPGQKPLGAISVVGAVTGQKITARKW